MFDWRKGLWSVCHGYVCILLYFKFLVWLCCIDLLSVRGGSGVSLPWVYLHSPICETYLV